MTSEAGARGTRRSRKSPSMIGQEVLRKSLPASLRHAVQNYRTVAFADPPMDAKEFQQHQSACKSALQHIEALLKLAGIVDAAGNGLAAATTATDTASLLARAEASVDAYSQSNTPPSTGE